MKSLVSLFVLLFSCFSHFAIAGKIALTFDDAPVPGSAFMSGEEKTRRIIESLKKAKVNDALFFVTTKNIDPVSKVRLKRYVDAGFHLAHHSHTHLSANKAPVNDYLLDFYTAHLALKPFDNVVKRHRFPYLHYGLEVQKRQQLYDGMKELGYELGYVTVDNYDWYLNGKMLEALEEGKNVDFEKYGQFYVDALWQAIKFYDDIAVKVLGRSPHHVLLLHENELAALFIGNLVEHIRQQGWEIISAEEAYGDPIDKQYSPEFAFNKQGRVGAIAYERGWKPEHLRHKLENTEYIDEQLKVLGVFNLSP